MKEAGHERSYLAALFIFCIAMPSLAQHDKLVRNRPDNIADTSQGAITLVLLSLQ